MKKRWVIKQKAPDEFRTLLADYHPIIADLLHQRGLTSKEEVDCFLNPDYEKDVHDPFLFREMDQAIHLVNEAIRAEERIVVHGDYDADGLSGAVILVSTLKLLGAKDVGVYLPGREKEGYGLNTNTVNLLFDQGTRLLITCDCGISNIDEIAEAKGLGMDVIVTDHHEQRPELPPCTILHPKVKGETYPFKDLAGGGVAFKFAQGLLRAAAKDEKTQKEYKAFEKWLLDMVAVASVADMVPLVGENRTLVKYGLMVLEKARRPGIKAIMTHAGLYPPKNGDMKLDAHAIGFIIGPRLNAAGRMAHANAAYAALMAENDEDAMNLALELENTNNARRAVTEKMMKEALDQIGEVPEAPSTLIAYNPAWSMGVVGLIAGRIMDKYNRPVFILSDLTGKIAGSGRSIEGYDCTEALDEVKDLLAKYGGHARACGFTLADRDKLDELKDRLNKFAVDKLTPEDLIPKINIDAEIKLADINWELSDQLEKMRPFGMANIQPLFMSKNLEVTEVNGCGAQNNHCRLTVSQEGSTKRGIAFQQPYWVKNLKVGDKVDLVYNVDINEFNGNRELQLKIQDIRRED